MMKRASIEERQAVEQAYENGSQIQYRLNNSDPWKDVDWPTFNWYLYDYRVKPEQYVKVYKCLDIVLYL